MESSLKVKFWGTRGIISTAEKTKVLFGGNTSCIQIIYEDTLLLVDMGHGANIFGHKLEGEIVRNKVAVHAHILFTHFHWDHIQGFPFFQPIYFPSTTLSLYSPVDTKILHDRLNVLFDPSYSPFDSLHKMPARIELHKMIETTQIGSLSVSFCAIDHGNELIPTFAYKIKAKNGQSVVIATDHEVTPTGRNQKLLNLAKGVDLLIHDGHFTESEYKAMRGHGHSSMEQALRNARACQAKYTLLTHHHPERTDSELLGLKKNLEQSPDGTGLKFDFAQEMIIYPVPF